MANEKILVVDDDTNICELLRLYLTKEGYQVTTANDGEEGLEKFNQLKPDMVLLDVMMPRMDGLEVCRRIRKLGNTPVMMLTAKGETFDKVLGLELGADDYMVKPFDTKEVVARIKAVLRRCTVTTSQTESTEGVIEFDNLRLDMNSYELRVKGKVVEAPPKELELLNCLASHPNRVYTRDQLLDEVWGFEYYGDSRTIDVHVKRLREKLAGASDKWELKTVWGVGYKFEVRQYAQSVSVAFFSLMSTLLIFGTVIMGGSELVLFSNYFAQERYDVLDEVVNVAQRTASHLVQEAALPEGEELEP